MRLNGLRSLLAEASFELCNCSRYVNAELTILIVTDGCENCAQGITEASG